MLNAWKFDNGGKNGLSSGKLTKDQFRKIVQHFDRIGKQPSKLILNSKQAERLQYFSQSLVVARYPGYCKWQGPDGKTWFEKLNTNEYKYYGSGNKAKRRLGYQYYEDGYDNFWSKTGESCDQCDW